MTDEGELVQRWRGLVFCYSKVACALDKALEPLGIAMSEFETMDRLAEGSDCEVRMNTLGSGMYLSQSALSRTVARLERAGLVARTMCPDDRRSIVVTLTEAGRELHARAQTIQRAVLAEQRKVMADVVSAGS